MSKKRGLAYPGSTEAHDYAEKKLSLALYQRFPGLIFCLHNHVGIHRTLGGQKVYIGMKGIPDIGGHLRGRAFFIEIKTGGAVRSPEQVAFAEMAERTGAVYILATFTGKWCDDDDRTVEGVCERLEQATAPGLGERAGVPLRGEADKDPRGGSTG